VSEEDRVLRGAITKTRRLCHKCNVRELSCGHCSAGSLEKGVTGRPGWRAASREVGVDQVRTEGKNVVKNAAVTIDRGCHTHHTSGPMGAITRESPDPRLLAWASTCPTSLTLLSRPPPTIPHPWMAMLATRRRRRRSPLASPRRLPASIGSSTRLGQVPLSSELFRALRIHRFVIS
jgi:hypothetical protein